MSNESRAHGGFTLVEVVVAILVLAVGVLALAGGAAATERSMADAFRIRGAAMAAENERERAYASTCIAAAGVDSVQGARIAWSATPGGTVLALTQSVTAPRANLIDIAAAGPCR